MTRRTPTLATLGLLAVATLAPAGCLVPVPVTPSAGPSTDPGAGGLVLPTGVGPGGNPVAGGPKLVNQGDATTTMNLGEGRSLTGFFRTDAGIAPTTGVVWTSNAEGVLTVNPTTGMAQALTKGTAIVTVALQTDPSVKAQITVNVADANGVQVIRLTPAQALLTAGEQQTLRAEVVLGTGEVKSNVVWSSSDDKIAKVDANGVVTAVALGTVQILASYADDPAFKGQATVRVVLNKDVPNAGVTPAPTGTTAPKGDDPGTVAVKNQGTWIDQPSGVTQDLTFVRFYDEKRGVAGGPGVFLATADGGLTWLRKPINAALTDAVDFDFPASGDGWVIGKNGTIHRTVDGSSYTKVVDFQAKYGQPLADVARSGNEAYAMLANGALYRSTDAGASWEFVSHPGFQAAPTAAPTTTPAGTPTPAATATPAPTPTPTPEATPTPTPAAYTTLAYNFQNNTSWGPLGFFGDTVVFQWQNSQSCKNWQTGGYYTCTTRKIYTRLGGGWTTADAPNQNYTDILFTNAREGWRLQQNQMERSVDGGQTWIPVETGIGGVRKTFTGPYFLVARDADHLLLGMGGGYISTDNNGRTWVATEIADFQMQGIAILDDTKMWAVGRGGKIKRYVVL